jgi:hypothetical protein
MTSHNSGYRPRDVFSIGPRRRFIEDNRGRLRAVVGWRSTEGYKMVSLWKFHVCFEDFMCAVAQ